MYSLPHLSLADKMQKILQSECSETKIKEGKTKLYKNLQKHAILDELHQRGISFWSQDKKGNLEDKLINEMHGMQRFPSLMQADQTIASMLEHYEILGCEPSHDVKHHIENMYVELPHLNKTEKRLMEETIQLSLERKEIKRGIDYRKSLIKSNVSLRRKIDANVFKILSTLCEIQDILYAGEMERTVENILRFHNQVFLHACLIRELVGSKAKSLTNRVLWGKYFHAIVYHAPVMYRIISGKTANTEQEERVFHTLKHITSITSNQHREHVLLNNMIRMQVREEMNLSELTKQQHEVRKLCHSLQEKCNTITYLSGLLINIHVNGKHIWR